MKEKATVQTIDVLDIKMINTNTSYSMNEDGEVISGPKYSSDQAAGFDFRADVTEDEDIVIKPMGIYAVPTGIRVALPIGWEMQIRPRSGLALKKGISLVNSPGTIDSDYRGEIKIIIINLGSEDFVIQHGDRVAQGVINKVAQANWIITDNLEKTERGEGGFGHTGV